jgi:hypothetical protein
VNATFPWPIVGAKPCRARTRYRPDRDRIKQKFTDKKQPSPSRILNQLSSMQALDPTNWT